MHEPKIFGLHIFHSISLRIQEIMMVCSSFCAISPCPTAAAHTSLSNYLGQQHQIIPTEIILKRDQNYWVTGPVLGWWPGFGQMQHECWEDRRKKNGCHKPSQSLANIIRGSKQHKMCNCRCSTSRGSGLSVIILSAQLRGSSYNKNRKHTEYQCWYEMTMTLFWSLFTVLYWLLNVIIWVQLSQILSLPYCAPLCDTHPPQWHLLDAVISLILMLLWLPALRRAKMPFSSTSNTRSSENSGTISRSSTGISNWDQ